MPYGPSQDSIKDLRARHTRTVARLRTLADILDHRSLTPAERDEFDNLSRQSRDIAATVKVRQANKRSRKALDDYPAKQAHSTRALGSDSTVRTTGRYKFGKPAEIQGTPNEILGPNQSMTEWCRRAAENGVHFQRSKSSAPEPIVYRDREFMNEAFGQACGFSKKSAEYRALGEDTPGSGQAITPQSWTANFVDYLYPMTLVGKLGISRVALPTEIMNVPVLTTPSAGPAWIPENSTIGIDAGAAFSTLQMNTEGGFKDIQLVSLELAQDAYVSGGLPELLQQSLAKKMAIAVDDAAIFGVTNNPGNPGLYNEQGFVSRKYTGDSGSGIAPSDTTEFSKVRELIRNTNTEATGGIVTNPSVVGTIARLNAPTYAKYWEMPADCTDLPFVYSTTMPDTETDSGTLTGGSLSSFIMGPWQFMLWGIHLELGAGIRLSERYIDYGQVGYFNAMRMSIRTAHASSFVRTTSIVTS
jgi:HK97 family phage major capsid protein